MKKLLPLLLLCLVLAVHHTTATTASSTTTTPTDSSSSFSVRRAPRRRSPARSLPTLPIQARGGGVAVKPKKATASAVDKDKKISLAYPILAAYLYNLRYVRWWVVSPVMCSGALLPPNLPLARSLLTLTP